jgi:DNA-binding transcriptional regulator YiaG
MYHYTESGLDNVWLANGYRVKETPYGRGVAVADVDDLHAVIARWLVNKPGRLTGKEFRFLRIQLGMAQRNLADMIDVTEQSVSLWERTGKVPKLQDAVLRKLVLEMGDGDGKLSEMIERINTVDRLVNQQLVVRTRLHKWIGKQQEETPDDALEAA